MTLAISDRRPPHVAYCPYCGSAEVLFVKLVPRCTACRAVFFVLFSRYTRSRVKPLPRNLRAWLTNT